VIVELVFDLSLSAANAWIAFRLPSSLSMIECSVTHELLAFHSFAVNHPGGSGIRARRVTNVMPSFAAVKCVLGRLHCYLVTDHPGDVELSHWAAAVTHDLVMQIYKHSREISEVSVLKMKRLVTLCAVQVKGMFQWL